MSAELTQTQTENEVTPGQPTAEVQERTNAQVCYQEPLVDIFQNAESLVVVADMPGLTNEGISVDVEKNVLTLKGTPTVAPEATPYKYREFAPTGYFRQFRLGDNVDQTGIAADYRHGVLRVTLPLAAETKPRQVTVKVG